MGVRKLIRHSKKISAHGLVVGLGEGLLYVAQVKFGEDGCYILMFIYRICVVNLCYT